MPGSSLRETMGLSRSSVCITTGRGVSVRVFFSVSFSSASRISFFVCSSRGSRNSDASRWLFIDDAVSGTGLNCPLMSGLSRTAGLGGDRCRLSLRASCGVAP
jgi:hypothetical protein